MEKRKRNGHKISKKIISNSQATQVIVCLICGDKGFTNALIDCSACPDTSVHQYCLGLPPGTIDDNFTWICECCSEPLQISRDPSSEITARSFRELPESRKPESRQKVLNQFSEKVAEKKIETLNKKLLPFENCCNCAIVIVEDQPSPLQVLPPLSYIRSTRQTETRHEFQDANKALEVSTFEYLDENIRETVLVVSPSGEVFICKHGNLSTASPSSSLATTILDVTLDGIAAECSIEETIELDEPSVGHEEFMSHLSETIGIVETDENVVELVNEASNDDGKFQEHMRLCSDGSEHTTSLTRFASVVALQHKVFIKDGPICERGSMKTDRPSKPTAVASIPEITDENSMKAEVCSGKSDEHGKHRDYERISDEYLILKVSEIMQAIQSVPSSFLEQHHLDGLKDTLKMLEDSEAGEKWLTYHYDHLEKLIHHLNLYTKSKQELAQCHQKLKFTAESLCSKSATVTELVQQHATLEEELNSAKELTMQLNCSIYEIWSICKGFFNKVIG